MRPNIIGQIARKELALFFASPVGYLFLAVFLAVTLFVFFWVETYFARNVADARPMFEWMPILLLFLCAALTMRMWSEERRTGTLEFVTTVPVRIWEFVLGKFMACMGLLILSLVLTLPLPLTIGIIANLDWGPVFAGYLAAVLLGTAYIAIGLFISARTDSQIVSLIIACFVSGLFYLVGSGFITDLFGGRFADLLRSIGTGSRFESITRGVLDFRDLYYYISLALSFLALNALALETQRWAKRGDRPNHRAWRWGTILLVANFLLANFWLQPLTQLRVDMTEGRIYSISDATRSYLTQLREPLLIRGYFSNKTHPLLAPLVPRMRDLLTEYQVAGGGNVRVEIVDPAQNPELEDEANTKYGIQPIPFQIADRYQSSMVNSYFNVLVSYGDEYQVLGFRDLIEVKMLAEDSLDVQLRNPEFDVTRAIKKVLFGFQDGNNLFANMISPVKFIGYFSIDEKLPEQLIGFNAELQQVLDELVSESGDRFSYEFIDPEAQGGELAAELGEQYGFRPMATSILDTEIFYYYMTLTDGETVVQVSLPDALSAEAAKQSMQAGLKRFASGLLKSVALVAPESNPYAAQMGGVKRNGYEQLRDYLSEDFNLETTTLEDGRVPEQAQILVVIDPSDLTTRQIFAVDQFLMQGGTVVLGTAPFAAQLSQQSLSVSKRHSGLEPWLAHHGLTLSEALVMDPQNAAFPVPVTREVSGFQFQEMVLLDYPYFIDVRDAGLNDTHPVTAGLPQVTMSWSSAIDVDKERNAERNIETLLSSSAASWQSDDTNVMPKVDQAGMSAFFPVGETGSYVLAAALEGKFTSFFQGKPSPLLAESKPSDPETGDDERDEDDPETDLGAFNSVIDRSPESSRLIVIASNDFVADQILGLLGSADGTFYSNSVQLVANVVDWSLEDQNLMSIRSRGHFNRTLPPLQTERRTLIEYGNYGLALLGILMVFLIHRHRQGRRQRIRQSWLQEAGI